MLVPLNFIRYDTQFFWKWNSPRDAWTTEASFFILSETKWREMWWKVILCVLVFKRNFIPQNFFAFPAVFLFGWKLQSSLFFHYCVDRLTGRCVHLPRQAYFNFGPNGAYYLFVTISGGLFSDLSNTYCKCLKWARGTSSIIMLRILKVMGNNAMYDRGAWFLRIIPKT